MIWTKEEIELLRKLLAQGLTCKQVGERMGRSDDSISRKKVSLGIVNPPSVWTDEMIDQLIEMTMRKVSSAKIARIMGITKGMVCGKRHRLGMLCPTKNPKAPPRTVNNHVSAWSESQVKQLRDLHADGLSVQKIAVELKRSIPSISNKLSHLKLKRINDPRPRKAALVEAVPVPEPIEAPVIECVGGMSIMQLMPCNCRYMIGALRYCGTTTVEDSPYCKAHHDLCYVQTVKKEKAPYKPRLDKFAERYMVDRGAWRS